MKTILMGIMVILTLGYAWQNNMIGTAVCFGTIVMLQNLDVQIHNHKDDDWL